MGSTEKRGPADKCFSTFGYCIRVLASQHQCPREIIYREQKISFRIAARFSSRLYLTKQLNSRIVLVRTFSIFQPGPHPLLPEYSRLMVSWIALKCRLNVSIFCQD